MVRLAVTNSMLCVTQLNKKFLACYGTWRLITVFTRFQHCFLSQAN